MGLAKTFRPSAHLGMFSPKSFPLALPASLGAEGSINLLLLPVVHLLGLPVCPHHAHMGSSGLWTFSCRHLGEPSSPACLPPSALTLTFTNPQCSPGHPVAKSLCHSDMASCPLAAHHTPLFHSQTSLFRNQRARPVSSPTHCCLASACCRPCPPRPQTLCLSHRATDAAHLSVSASCLGTELSPPSSAPSPLASPGGTAPDSPARSPCNQTNPLRPHFSKLGPRASRELGKCKISALL